MNDSLMTLSCDVLRIAENKVRAIQKTVSRSKTLSLNAMILAAKAGTHGAGFAVVAREAVEIANAIDVQAKSLETDLEPTLAAISRFGTEFQGARLHDLALHLIEIIDRNLYERSCDVRWWATDAAVVACLVGADEAALAHASQRLGVILDSYTVYADIWVCDLAGRVVANGRPQRFPEALGASMAHQSWFHAALATTAGDQFAVGEVAPARQLAEQTILTYSTAVRAGGKLDGEVIGVLGIHFDWQAQSQQVVDGVRLDPLERSRSRCVIVDANGLVLAASDHVGALHERLALPAASQGGHVIEGDALIGYALTPGYESYRGQGWFGAIVQR